MFKRLVFVLSLLLTLGITAPVAAQEVPVTGIQDLDGLESGYARMFMPDLMAMFDAMSTPGAEIPELDEDGTLMVMTAVLTFDSQGDVSEAMDQLLEDAGSGVGTSERIEGTEVKDLGDRAVLFNVDADDQDEVDMQFLLHLLLVQDNSMLYMVVVGTGENGGGEEQAQEIAAFMLDKTPGSDEVVLNLDGTSTGGVFDLMPTAEDADLVGGLSPFMDMDMLDDEMGF